MAFLQVCEGRSKRWLLHLYGAEALLSAHNNNDNSQKSSSYHFFTDLYYYLCCIASVLSLKAPGTLGMELRLASAELSSDCVHPLFGVAAKVYGCLVRINIAEYLKSEADAIDMNIQNWTTSDLHGLHNLDLPRHLLEARATGAAMQWATRIRLLQGYHCTKKDDNSLKEAVDNIISALSLVRAGSEMEPRLLFPLFMAGVASTNKPQRLTVEYRLNIIERTVGFGNIFTAHSLLDEVWKLTNEGEVVDWQVLMREKYPDLVLL